MVTQSELRSIAKSARNKLYEEHNTTREDDPDRIEGYCHENAFKVAEYLYREGIDCIFVWGSLTNMSQTSAIDQAEIDGSVHHWVEVPKSNLSSCENELNVYRDTYVIDPYALGSHKGELYVSDELPRDYQRLKGGFIKYESGMSPTDFISLDKYTKLPKDVFVFEKAEM